MTMAGDIADRVDGERRGWRIRVHEQGRRGHSGAAYLWDSGGNSIHLNLSLVSHRCSQCCRAMLDKVWAKLPEVGIISC